MLDLCRRNYEGRERGTRSVIEKLPHAAREKLFVWFIHRSGKWSNWNPEQCFLNTVNKKKKNYVYLEHCTSLTAPSIGWARAWTRTGPPSSPGWTTVLRSYWSTEQVLLLVANCNLLQLMQNRTTRSWSPRKADNTEGGGGDINFRHTHLHTPATL